MKTILLCIITVILICLEGWLFSRVYDSTYWIGLLTALITIIIGCIFAYGIICLIDRL